MDKNKAVEAIAKCIVNAQICSDAGKYIYDEDLCYSSLCKAMQKKAYKGKDTQIFKAISLINCNKGSGFYYFVTKDKQYIADYIVYFNFKINGKRKQISFHSYDKRLERFTGKSCNTYWDRKSSRQAVIELAQLLLNFNC